jgi:hypothetical protein
VEIRATATAIGDYIRTLTDLGEHRSVDIVSLLHVVGHAGETLSETS